MAEVVVFDHRSARRQPPWQLHAETPDRQEIMIAGEAQAVGHRHDLERHADSVSHIFFKSSGSGETLGAMDYLWKARAAAIKPAPHLPAGPCVLTDADHSRHIGVSADRQRRSNQAQGLGKQPAKP